jgi:hypothetical protein
MPNNPDLVTIRVPVFDAERTKLAMLGEPDAIFEAACRAYLDTSFLGFAMEMSIDGLRNPVELHLPRDIYEKVRCSYSKTSPFEEALSLYLSRWSVKPRAE